MDTEDTEWLAFGYKMVHLPSRCRVYVWRKLKEMGAIRYQQGVVFLPRSERFIEVVTELKEDIIRFGGEASIADVRFFDPKDENALAIKFNDNIRSACKEVERFLKNLSEEVEKIRATGKTTQAFLEDKLRTLKKHKSCSKKFESGTISKQVIPNRPSGFLTPFSIRSKGACGKRAGRVSDFGGTQTEYRCPCQGQAGTFSAKRIATPPRAETREAAPVRVPLPIRVDAYQEV